MRKFVLVLMLAMLMTSAAWAQTCIVGHTNLTPVSTNLPWYHLYDYSETQYCIPAADMAMCFPGPDPVTITSIGWYYVSGTLPPTTQYALNVYLNESTVGCGTICTTRVANGTLVATGKTLPAGTAPTALYITLDTSFTYNPGNDLIVTVCDTGVGWTSGAGFAANTLTGDGGQRYRDGTVYDCDALTNDGGSSACRNYWPTTCFGYVGAASTLTMLAPGGLGTGTVSPAVGTTTYSVGGTANIVATPAFGSVFDYWEVDGVYYSDLASDTLIMDTDHTVQAFFDLASAVPIPFCEDFTGLAAGAIPTGWGKSPSTTNWGASLTANAGGTSPEMMLNYSPSATDVFRLITPQIDATSATNLSLWFKHMINHYTTPYTLRVQTSPDLTTWTDVWTLDPTASVPAETVMLDITALAGTEFYVAFVFDGYTFNINYWYIDDFCVGPPPATYNLTMLAPIGSGSVVPAVGVTPYLENSVVPIEAYGCGSTFVEWLVDGVFYSNTAITTLTMDMDHTVQASFANAEVEDLLFCQYGTTNANAWTAVLDTTGGYDYEVAENFWGISGTIEKVVFYGLSLIYSGGWVVCAPPATEAVIVKFYNGAGEFDPNPPTWTTPVSSQNLVAEVTNAGPAWTGYDLWRYEMVLTTPISTLYNGWVSFQMDVDSGAPCWMLVMNSDVGDGEVYQKGASPELIANDAKVELWGTSGPPPVFHDLTMLAPSGNGTVVPAPGVHTYVENSVVNVSAMDGCGGTFSHWVGNVADPNAAATTITMDADYTIQAVFDSTTVVFSEDFETGATGWTYYDADGDTYFWYVETDPNTTPHTGLSNATSASYDNVAGALTPDNWMVSPQIDLTGNSVAELSWYVGAQDQAWANENYDVLVSTTGNTIPDFTNVVHSEIVQPGGPDGNNYWLRTVDLTAYAGQQIYIAFRHYNVTDMFRINVDDICITGDPIVVPTDTPTGPTPTPGPIPTTGPAGIGLLLVAIGALMSLAGLRRK